MLVAGPWTGAESGRISLDDRDRRFIHSVSGRGSKTCWLVGTHERFHAAVRQNSLTESDARGRSDLPRRTEGVRGGRPWHVPRALPADNLEPFAT
jgi:hypothetical protein